MAIGRAGYSNGVVGFLELGERAGQSFTFRVVGSEGMIIVNDPDGSRLKLLSSARPGGWHVPRLPEIHSTIHGELKELIAAVEGHTTHRSDAKIGRVAMEIIMGLYESSARRCVMEFPIEVMDFPLTRMIREGLV